MGDEGWELSFQWIPAHSSIPGNERADALAVTADFKEPSVTIQRTHDARHFIHADVQRRHPHPDVARGSPPNPVPPHRISSTASSLLHRLRIDCAFTQEKLFLLGLVDTADCPSCASVEDLEHAIWKCPAHHDARAQLLRTLRSTGHPCASVKDILLPSGSARLVSHFRLP